MKLPEELSASESRPKTILVADDDPITRQLLKRFLEEYGHNVLVAADGEQAWALFLKHEPGLVITDWRMPKLDGLELCTRIRERDSSNYTFVLVLTSAADHEAMVQGFAAGADDFMTKPFDRAELTWRIYSGVRVLELQCDLNKRISDLDEAHEDLRKAHDAMHAGLEAAAEAQRALLPTAPPDVKGIQCAWSYESCDHLGGDSLNVFKLDDHRVGFFIADVCGHGIAPALLAVSLHRVLSPAAGQAGLLNGDDSEDPTELFADPGRVLTEVNRRYPIKIEEGEYFTSVYGVIDSERGELRFAGAGHPSPILLTNDGPPEQLSTDGFPIGFDVETSYETQTVPLSPGDRLCFYSDGIAEAKHQNGDMYGIERLIKQLQAQSKKSLATVVNAIADDVQQWERVRSDDVCFIVIDFEGLASEADERETALIGQEIG